jgi:hypothetical protein
MVIALLLLAFQATMAQQIPAGTVLSVMLTSTLDARHSKPGQTITGKIMQDVPLPDGSRIPKGARVVGHVVSASPATAGSPSRLAIKFDHLIVDGRQIPSRVYLRALASSGQVFEATMPTNAFDDYGTSTSDWNTIQIGGAGVYRGNGQVVSGDQVVGRATDYGAVMARLIPAPRQGCTDSSEREQALWLFSPWACGVYGYEDLIAHNGMSDPIGEIVFESSRDVHIEAGSGWLLRTEPTQS